MTRIRSWLIARGDVGVSWAAATFGTPFAFTWCVTAILGSAAAGDSHGPLAFTALYAAAVIVPSLLSMTVRSPIGHGLAIAFGSAGAISLTFWIIATATWK